MEQCSSGHDLEIDISEEDFSCFLYPSDLLNCSWSLSKLPTEAKLSVYISVDESGRTVQEFVSEERVGSIRRQFPTDHNLIHVIQHFNVSLRNMWTVQSYMYVIETLEVLPPPPNVIASFRNGSLLVTWGLPSCRKNCVPRCLHYNLLIDDQEKFVTEKLSYTELNVDTTHTYKVKIRTMKVEYFCEGSHKWSDWSPTVTVQSVQGFKPLVIVAISLGIPMILLALLLFFRHLSLYKVLFPPIPRPPPKYMHFLEKNDTFNLHSPPSPAKPEEITEVLDTEETPGKAVD
ncbi:interleukin-13 receptor subunit alpha-1-like isoform X2 [Sphaeramia orbicularis]|nr:interleukin-13 receptor subunit alpha-1-like isoform X2 [Sphaeramia orbicularis]